jgi:hypothetical protein
MLDVTRRKTIGIAAGTLATVVLPWRGAVAEQSRLAIRGYDPVSYFTPGRPERGVPEFEYEWDEQRYRFASAAHREMFKTDPVRYAPQFANFCAAALARGITVEANPEYWLVRDSKLYLFTLPAGPELFQRDYAGNAEKAEQNRNLTKN